MATAPAVVFQNVSFALDSGLQIFSNLNLEVPAGQRCILAGTSRSGSSFFGRLALGLFRPDRGIVRVLGVDVSHLPLSELQLFRQRTGFVFRDARLISNMTLERNIALPLTYHRTLPPEEMHRRVEELIDMFELGPMHDMRPELLTPEQRMLGAFARSAVMAPAVLFYDDPLAGFPPDASARLLTAMRQVREWIAENGTTGKPPTMLVAVSEPGPYLGFADRFGTFRDGKVFFDRQQYMNF